MDRLDELAVFVAIVDGGSLAAASRRLRRSPPATTRALSALEARLGVKLIERTTRRLAPTEAGRRLAEHARRLLADFDEAMREAAGESAAPRGRLTIAAPSLFGRLHVAPIVTAFLDDYADVSAELMLSDRVVDLVEEGVDVAVRIGRPPDSALVARRVGALRRMTVAAPDYLAKRGTPRRPSDLARHEIVLFSGVPGAQAARFSVNQAEAAVAAAVEGRGVLTALSYQVEADLAAGRLERILREFEPEPIPVHLIFPSARFMAPRLRAFLDFAAPRLSALKALKGED